MHPRPVLLLNYRFPLLPLSLSTSCLSFPFSLSPPYTSSFSLSSSSSSSSSFSSFPLSSGSSALLKKHKRWPWRSADHPRNLFYCRNIHRTEEEVGSETKKMAWMKILSEGIFRFDSCPEAREKAWPSLSFADPSKRETCLGSLNGFKDEPEYKPIFISSHDQQIVTIELPAGTSFYGTGEVSGSLERTGKRTFCWNTDAWGYSSSTTSLYQAHPWVMAVFPDGNAFGVLADTTRRCEIDLCKEGTIKFVALAPYPIITFGPYSSPTKVLMALSKAIGTLSMPPKWSLGYHQCRWSYEPDSRVMEVAQTFREKCIPCDVIWMDIDYMDGFRCFTFDPVKFSDPKGLAQKLHNQGFKAIWMLDPGIKEERGYSIFDSGSSQNAWILKPDGKPYLGEVWPGLCAYPDYTSERTRKWWAVLVSDFISNGVDGIWNDMNEPTLFKAVTKTIPENCIHCGDADLGGRQNHAYYHNVYGMLMARSTYEGSLLANSNKRPFVLTRAGYIGSQRYGATWTGDNFSTWDHLHMSIAMVLNLGLSGQPFTGPDIGGFAGNATPRLFARWMGIGALFPFSRAHSEAETNDHEPWSFGDECLDVCRRALARRYRILPHLYTLFYKSHMTGVPVMSPLFFADPKDPRLRNVEDSFLLGPLLVSASTVPKIGSNKKETIFPQGIWHRFDFDDDHPDLPRLYLKGGSIIPSGPVIQHVGDMIPENVLTLLVALDDNGKAEGQLYEDDGDGYEYQKGNFLLSTYVAEHINGHVHIKLLESEGLLVRPKRKLKVVLLIGEGGKIEADGLDGHGIRLELPSADVIKDLVSQSQQKQLKRMENAASVYDKSLDNEALKDGGAPTLIEMSGGEWQLKVIPSIGGRIISMIHSPTGIEWLWSRVEKSGYEEYSGKEYCSAGCTEVYEIKTETLQMEMGEALCMEGDIGGGLVLQRKIFIPKSESKILQIGSQIIAKSVGAGAGGFSRIVCLRVHPMFQLRNPLDTYIRYTAVNGAAYELSIDSGEVFLEGDDRPNGEWMLVDDCAKVALVNRFKVEEVSRCLISWGPGTCNLELWSEERPVSRGAPISIDHQYQTLLL